MINFELLWKSKSLRPDCKVSESIKSKLCFKPIGDIIPLEQSHSLHSCDAQYLPVKQCQSQPLLHHRLLTSASLSTVTQWASLVDLEKKTPRSVGWLAERSLKVSGTRSRCHIIDRKHSLDFSVSTNYGLVVNFARRINHLDFHCRSGAAEAAKCWPRRSVSRQPVTSCGRILSDQNLKIHFDTRKFSVRL